MEKLINGTRYTFVNKAVNTRNGFKHTSTLVMNGEWLVEATIHYINRTWERYQFQSVMRKCVEISINTAREEYIGIYKTEKGITRLTPARKAEVLDRFERLEFVKELRELQQGL